MAIFLLRDIEGGVWKSLRCIFQRSWRVYREDRLPSTAVSSNRPHLLLGEEFGGEADGSEKTHQHDEGCESQDTTRLSPVFRQGLGNSGQADTGDQKYHGTTWCGIFYNRVACQKRRVSLGNGWRSQPPEPRMILRLHRTGTKRHRAQGRIVHFFLRRRYLGSTNLPMKTHNSGRARRKTRHPLSYRRARRKPPGPSCKTRANMIAKK